MAKKQLFLEPNEFLRHLKLRYRYLSLAKKPVCFLMHNFQHDLREWMHYFQVFFINIQEYKHLEPWVTAI